MNQISLPLDVSPEEVARKKSLGAAITLCVDVAGFEPKQIQAALSLDKAQFSRWESGEEGVVWPKLAALMDACGNDAPILWMLAQRGYDLRSLRKVETEVEKQLREARDQNAALMKLLIGKAAA